MWSWQYYIIYAPMPTKLADGGGNYGEAYPSVACMRPKKDKNFL